MLAKLYFEYVVTCFFCRYPSYRYGYGHLKGYGYYGHPYGLGYYGYGHYGKRSASPSRHPQPKSVAPYLHYDLGRKLGYFAYRGYPQVRTNQATFLSQEE